MTTYSLLRIISANALFLSLLSSSGCSREPASAIKDSVIADASAATVPTPTPRPKPAPRPTPDAHSIPGWAQGKVIEKVPVRPGQKVFALTFDDGPWPEYTREILAILKRHKARATFFMVGQEITRRPEIAREIKAQGHALGSHSWDHPMRPRNPKSQISRTDAALRSVGVKNTIFRPPYGAMHNGMAREAMHKKQAVLLWSADSSDWKQPGAAAIARRIINQASPGGIGLMHDGGGNRASTVAALPRILKNLHGRGYKLVTIPELLRMRYIAPKPKASKKPAAKIKSGSKTRIKADRKTKAKSKPAESQVKSPAVVGR